VALAADGYRDRSSRYKVTENVVSFAKDQLTQTKHGDSWSVEFSYLDKTIPTVKQEPRIVQDGPGLYYELFPIKREDTGERWITELDIVNEQLENYTEKSSTHLLKYSTQHSAIQCSRVLGGE
jgi:hypothetical protein